MKPIGFTVASPEIKTGTCLAYVKLWMKSSVLLFTSASCLYAWLFPALFVQRILCNAKWEFAKYSAQHPVMRQSHIGFAQCTYITVNHLHYQNNRPRKRHFQLNCIKLHYCTITNCNQRSTSATCPGTKREEIDIVYQHLISVIIRITSVEAKIKSYLKIQKLGNPSIRLTVRLVNNWSSVRHRCQRFEGIKPKTL